MLVYYQLITLGIYFRPKFHVLYASQYIPICCNTSKCMYMYCDKHALCRIDSHSKIKFIQEFPCNFNPSKYCFKINKKNSNYKELY